MNDEITAKEFAVLHDVDVVTVYRHIWAGKLKARYFGGVWVLNPAEKFYKSNRGRKKSK